MTLKSFVPLLGVVVFAWAGNSAPPLDVPRAAANDNRKSAGVRRGDTLVLRLYVGKAEWYPEAKNGPHITVEAFGEEGKAPSIPAPLIRVKAGTPIRVTVRNALSDSTIHLIGLGTHPIPVTDTFSIAPGASAERVFNAGAPGTYLYRAVIGNDPDGRPSERETANGAFVIDPEGGSPPDRIFVINLLSYELDASRARTAIGFNGKSWPYTERLPMTVGDSVHWRLLNGTTRGHPIHLHGFYFQVDEAGTGLTSRTIPEAQRRLSVTEQIPPWQTRTLKWSPDRPGNWLLHCHLTFHVTPEARLDNDEAAAHQDHSGEAAAHMAGLVLGIPVAPRRGESYERSAATRRLNLFAHQGGPRGAMPATYSYVLQRGPSQPARDSIRSQALSSWLPVVSRLTSRSITAPGRGPSFTGMGSSWRAGRTGWPDGATMARRWLPRLHLAIRSSPASRSPAPERSCITPT